MSRDMQPANVEAIKRNEVHIIGFFEGEFASGRIRLWSGYGDYHWRGEAWTGAGHLIAISEIEETNGVVASGVTVSLSGISQDMIATAINEARQGMPGRIWIGFCSADWQLLADPELVFSGLLDVPQISEDGTTATVSISYESQLIDLQRPREWRYTHESQQQIHPGDRAFEFVTSIQEIDLKWGR
ncbi:hypothetical protein ACFOHK_08170 [Falsigemmobacter intermedius]|uniref:Uncharacterized protein n=1 Tax=Falsigemmobacter intermedius TaxID=1553448 RepID=A0A451GGT5_9RHOB|nr:hypothetical protein [Falsigemmobacter intermedius]RWY36428.1 hypothetical protein EP867_17860 [Falsigemmobacter intermedius]